MIYQQLTYLLYTRRTGMLVNQAITLQKYLNTDTENYLPRLKLTRLGILISDLLWHNFNKVLVFWVTLGEADCKSTHYTSGLTANPAHHLHTNIFKNICVSLSLPLPSPPSRACHPLLQLARKKRTQWSFLPQFPRNSNWGGRLNTVDLLILQL